MTHDLVTRAIQEIVHTGHLQPHTWQGVMCNLDDFSQQDLRDLVATLGSGRVAGRRGPLPARTLRSLPG